MNAETMPTLPTTQPCPPWCSEPSGHPYREECGEVQRWHRTRVGEVELTQLEWVALTADGPRVDTDGVFVCITDHNGSSADLRPEHVSRLLPDLQRALSLLD